MRKRLNQDGLLDIAQGISGYESFSLSMDAMYNTGGLYSEVVDRPSEDAFSKGFIIHGDSKEELVIDFERLRIEKVLEDCARFIELHGGAVIIPIIKGGAYKRFDVPYNPKSNYTIEGLIVRSIIEFSSIGILYEDASSPKFGTPQFYRWNNVDIHESRMIGIMGAPWAIQQNDNPFLGRATAGKMFKAVSDYYDAVSLTLEVLKRKQQPVYQMVGMAGLLSDDIQDGTKDGQTLIQKRIALVDSVRSLLNTVTIDGGTGGKEEATDSYTINDMNLSGLKEVVEIVQIQLSANTGIPVSILFGESASGMNATGEGDWKGYYTKLESIQSRFKPALERLTAMLAAQKGVSGVDDNWHVEFIPLAQLSEKEEAEIDKIKADALKVHVDSMTAAFSMGIMTADEMLEYMKEEKLFGLHERKEITNEGAVEYANELNEAG